MQFKSFSSAVVAGVTPEDVAVGAKAWTAQLMNQVHGVEIGEVSAVGAAVEGDALVTRVPGVRLMVKTADCIPLVFADETAGIVAAVHAGWRGLTADIVPLVVARLVEMGAVASRLQVGVGPSLGVECAEFSDPATEIPAKYQWAVREDRHVDLLAILARQLEESGVHSDRVEWMRVCTACSHEWFSWRRDKDARRFGTFVELK